MNKGCYLREDLFSRIAFSAFREDLFLQIAKFCRLQSLQSDSSSGINKSMKMFGKEMYESFSKINWIVTQNHLTSMEDARSHLTSKWILTSIFSFQCLLFYIITVFCFFLYCIYSAVPRNDLVKIDVLGYASSCSLTYPISSTINGGFIFANEENSQK